MNGRTYCPFSYAEFSGWMKEIGFSEIQLPNTWEYVFERAVHCKQTENRLDRFKIRIMSSVSTQTGISRENGADAIRVVLFDATLDRPAISWSVKRTATAKENTIQKARDAWAYVSQHPENHCKCGALMVKREGKGYSFIGCSAFPTCKEKR